MLSGEVLLLCLCLSSVVVGGILYLCCKELGTREKKKFRHTSFIIREKELEEVLSSNPVTKDGTVPNGGHESKERVHKTSSKGEDFYAGRDSLSGHHHHKKRADDEADLVNEMAFGQDEEEELFHAGMAKSRVLGGDQDRVLGEKDRVLA